MTYISRFINFDIGCGWREKGRRKNRLISGEEEKKHWPTGESLSRSLSHTQARSPLRLIVFFHPHPSLITTIILFFHCVVDDRGRTFQLQQAAAMAAFGLGDEGANGDLKIYVCFSGLGYNSRRASTTQCSPTNECASTWEWCLGVPATPSTKRTTTATILTTTMMMMTRQQQQLRSLGYLLLWLIECTSGVVAKLPPTVFVVNNNHHHRQRGRRPAFLPVARNSVPTGNQNTVLAMMNPSQSLLLELRGGGSTSGRSGGGGDDDDDSDEIGHRSESSSNFIVQTLLSSTSGILHNVIRSVCRYCGWLDDDTTSRRLAQEAATVRKSSSQDDNNNKKIKRKISEALKKNSLKGDAVSAVTTTKTTLEISKTKKKKTPTGSRGTATTTSANRSTAATATTTKPSSSSSSSSNKSTKKKKAPSQSPANNKAAATTTTTTGTKKKNNNVHLKTTLKVTNPNYRIQQELRNFLHDPPDHLGVKVGKNIRIWIVTMDGVGIYQGERFTLRIAFPAKYPTVPPSVYFSGPVIPQHEHVYTNGDICLSLLGKDWRPNMTAQSIAISILSILGSASHKSLPMDNARHAQNRPGQYQQDWVYHDDCTFVLQSVCLCLSICAYYYWSSFFLYFCFLTQCFLLTVC
jgi:ubiquitin-conjugating enzyme E2 W